MSKTTKRKHVTREVLDEYTLPEEHQKIVKVTASRGNNLHEVQTAAGELFLVSMPTRFRKNVWIKRGDFVIIDPIVEGDKVKAEIATILYPKQVKYIQKEGLWPDEFLSKPIVAEQQNSNQNGNHDTTLIAKDLSGLKLTDERQPGADDSDSDTDSDADLFVNTNRPTVTYYYTDSEDEGEEEGNGLEEGNDQEDEVR